VTGFADTSTQWSAERLDGRVLIVRNGGDGVLSLVGNSDRSASDWRLNRGVVLAAGELAVLVYDATSRRWRVISHEAPTLPLPAGVR
jgi:hypothetical protein